MLWMEAEERFADGLPGFQVRENQRALAMEIEAAFESYSHLLAQAGCGTGKSFAGIIPAIGHSKRLGMPVILATATKALQDQYSEKDLPFLQQVLAVDEELPFTFAVIKGRSNYVCRQKLEEWNDYAKAEVELIINDENFSGEVIDIPNGASIATDITVTSDECPGKSECPFGETCFAERAKVRARTANLVVVNHAVLAADTAVKAAQIANGVPIEKATALLPPFNGCVVDEGHEMEEYVTSALGETITAGSLGRLGVDISKFLTKRDATKALSAAVDAVFDVVRTQLNARQNKADRNVEFTSDTLVALEEPMINLIATLTRLREQVVGTQIYGDDEATQKRVRLSKRLSKMIDKLRSLMTADFTELVRWMSLPEGNRGETIEWAPLSVADFLRTNLWAHGPATIMSATLALGDDFSFLAGRLGLDEYEDFDAGTPFNFKAQACTFIPQIAHPVKASKEKWRASTIAIASELVRASNGRALSLYTSRKEMDEAYASLSPMITRMGHQVLKQGDAPNKMLAAEFKNDEHSVLFALKSFFTGIDVQGDSLRLLMIDKLPFPVPTDVIFKARCDAIDKGAGPWGSNGSFNKLTVPSMALTILQGYGRLIRTVEDRGMVAIMDSRLYGPTSKPYGPRIMAVLPDAPIVTTLDEAVGYLEGLES